MSYPVAVGHVILSQGNWVAIRTVSDPGDPYSDPNVESGDNVEALRSLGTFSLDRRNSSDRAFLRIAFTARGRTPLGEIQNVDVGSLKIATIQLHEIIQFGGDSTLDRVETITTLNNNVIVSRENVRNLTRGHQYAMHMTGVTGISAGNDLILLGRLA